MSAPQEQPPSEWTREQAIFHLRSLSWSVAGEMAGGEEELEQARCLLCAHWVSPTPNSLRRVEGQAVNER